MCKRTLENDGAIVGRVAGPVGIKLRRCLGLDASLLRGCYANVREEAILRIHPLRGIGVDGFGHRIMPVIV